MAGECRVWAALGRACCSAAALEHQRENADRDPGGRLRSDRRRDGSPEQYSKEDEEENTGHFTDRLHSTVMLTQ